MLSNAAYNRLCMNILLLIRPFDFKPECLRIRYALHFSVTVAYEIVIEPANVDCRTRKHDVTRSDHLIPVSGETYIKCK